MSKLPMPFANPTTYPGHSGVDFPQPARTPILASGPGVVESVGYNPRGGFYVWIKYDGVASPVGYHHMPDHRKVPPRGSRVNFGQQIGEVGSTGNSTGPHLHSEVSGHATTDGYWTVFDSTKTVHDTVSTDKDSAMDFINIQGKSKSHRAGQFAIYRGNADGKLYARRLTYDTLNPAFPTIDNEGLVSLQKAMPFLDL